MPVARFAFHCYGNSLVVGLSGRWPCDLLPRAHCPWGEQAKDVSLNTTGFEQRRAFLELFGFKPTCRSPSLSPGTDTGNRG